MIILTIIDEHALVPVGVAITIVGALAAIIWKEHNRRISECERKIELLEREQSKIVNADSIMEKLASLLETWSKGGRHGR